VENELLLRELEEELVRLRKVRNLLAGKCADATWESASRPRAGKKHALTPEGRQRIAEAQKKRWAIRRLETSASQVRQ
jgi:hypothetical protein